MNKLEHTLTGSNIKYLLALYMLNSDSGKIRCVAVASALGVSRPSAHKMIKTLEKMELVKRSKSGIVYFTDYGNWLAGQYDKFFSLFCQYLQKTLPEQADCRKVSMLLFTGKSIDQIAAMCQSIQEQSRGA